MKHLLCPPARRASAWFLISIMILQVALPTRSYALTGGPSQPEVQSFEPIGTSEMVDVSSGSFTYNIPLIDVGGYPINLAYHSGSTPDDEASVCGLGWNINPGVINRNMRGLPDDFNGDPDAIKKEFNMKPNQTWGGNAGFKFELFGLSKKMKGKGSFSLGLNMGVFYNNYKGVGLEFGVMPGFSAGEKGSSTASFGLGLTANSQSGITLSPSMSFSAKLKETARNGDQGNIMGGLSIGSPINSRTGLTALTIGTTLGISGTATKTVKKTGANGGDLSTSQRVDFKHSLYGGSSSFSFATPTYAPSATLPFRNLSASTTFSIGFELTGVFPAGSITGYYSEQRLAKKSLSAPAYGFLYAENAKGKDLALMDFNREKDGTFSRYTKHLPAVVFTNDVYGVTGQGIAGSYQLKRGDIGVLSDARVNTPGFGGSFGFEVGVGAPPPGFHGGGDLVLNATNSWSGRWRKDNTAAGLLDFQALAPNNPGYEPAYFKIAGEKSVETDPGFFKDNGGADPVRVHLNKGTVTDMNVEAANFFETEGNTRHYITRSARKQRERRNQAISYLSAGEAKDFGLEKKIRSYPFNDFDFKNSPPAEFDRTGGANPSFRKAHHLSEISVLRQDGLRYFYGIPAYNIEQNEVSFSVDGSSANCSNGLVFYNKLVDDSDKNTEGDENYYNKVKVPAYAHSYLLTAVVSPDYVDLTHNGPSPDDYGTYTKFNYHRVYEHYNWRIPYEADKANFNEGFKSEDEDDKANYVSGKKEYWVLHSVESKTQVAAFFYDRQNRPDALDANGQKLPKLLRIELYSLPDLRDNGLAGANPATPIKTVHFEYDNSLCPGLPYTPFNPQLGKLTLTKLWFTYGTSQKGKLSPYKFVYGKRWNGKIINPPYDLKAYNRWGTYQKNNGAVGTGCYKQPESAVLNTSDYPYVPQGDTLQADENAAAYNLTNITLPSGGEIKVEYEANRYAYTQDRAAMEMMEVAGVADNANACPGSNALYTLPNSGNNYVFFKLRKPVANKDEFYEKYLRHAFGDKTIADGYLYFKFLIRVNSVNSNPAKYEYVPGYVQISGSDYGVIQKQSGTYGYIELRETEVADLSLPQNLPIQLTITSPNKTNPISKAAWQFTRLHLPKIAYDSDGPTGSTDEAIITSLAGMVKNMEQFAIGFNNSMYVHRYAEQFAPEKSWIRLCNPEQNKIAGGARVKSIRISDNWNKMETVVGSNFDYGQLYDYTTVTPKGDTISSGVAAYEPMLGGDENPFRQPQIYTNKPVLAPSDEFIQEEPFGESYFPSPQIVYSRVTVRNLPRTDVERTATGWVVQEFYTARDFPTKTGNTGVLKVPKRTSPLLKQLLLKHKDFMTASEGFVVELNDMHGRPKAQWVYNESGTRLSGVEYRYKRQGDRLVNEGIPVVSPNGIIQNAIVGLDFSMTTDCREVYSKTRTAGIQLNTDNFLVGVFPAMAVIPLPSYHAEETRFRSMVAIKVIQRYGLLEETIAYDLGASVSTRNVAWDAETGEVILTQTENEFHDPIFNLNIPAHWGYEGMRGADGNLGAVFSGLSISNGKYAANTLHPFFTPGDELILTPAGAGATPVKVWVKDVDRSNGDVYLIDIDGQWVAYNSTLQNVKLKNIRSGRRNQQLNSIGSVVTRQRPIVSAHNMLSLNGVEILNAGATEYSDRWQTWCAAVDESTCNSFPGKSVNPYRTNNRGVFRPLRSWAYLTDRKQVVAATNIRTDGPFTAFSPFWAFPYQPGQIIQRLEPNPIWKTAKTGWTWTAEVTRNNPVGNELENRDTLSRFAGELTGYAQTQVVASAKNARYRQIAFDGFEDYAFEASADRAPCLRRHFEFTVPAGQSLPFKKGVSHSGKYALQLTPASPSISANHSIKSPVPPDCPAPLAAKPVNSLFKLDDCDCVGVFMPDPGQYIFSAWVREDRPANALNFNMADVKISAAVSGQPLSVISTLKASGPIIEGWQRISGEFSLPAGTTSISVGLNAAPGTTTWFDDLRIHPFDASFKSYVYDDVSLKFTYELDENNFFTKYEYDQQGMLERVKKETERGVMTIQESKFAQQKN